jgi:hemerythrin-like domain-containing protein
MPMPPRRTPSLPGFSAPAAGFDEPVAMLHACHERVRRSLDLLARLCERVEQGRVDQAVHDAAADVLRYFDLAAPQHHEDEEQHVFPRLSRHPDAAMRAAVLKLQEDHIAMEAHWARLRTPLAALAEGQAAAFGQAQVEQAAHFRALYDGHAQTEEQFVFPAAEALLDDAALRAMGEEMARRRGARPPPSR